MSVLPPGLRDWEPLLEGFDPDLALSLGPWLARLSLAIGPLHTNARPGTGEPDGYAGLTRRGPYERLLLTEWAVAEVIPEEFTRRAAMGEHLFLERRHQEPAGRRRSIVLFDAGPDQLGAPRIAQIAILVVLARRAERAGIPLSFGALQDGELTPFTDVGRLTSFRATRSARAPNASDIRTWIARIEPVAGDDLWLVGGPGAVGPLAHIRIEEPVEPGDRTLSVEVRPLGRASRRIGLALPPPNEAVRILRDPYRRAVAAPQSGQPTGTGGLRFSNDGRRLIGWSARGDVVAWHVPNSPRAAQDGSPRFFHPPDGDELIAAGFQRRNILAVTRGTDGYQAWPRHRFGAPFAAEEATEVAPRSSAPPSCLVNSLGSDEHLHFLDPTGDLWRWTFSGLHGRPTREARAEGVDQDVLALGLYGDQPVWIRHNPDGSYAIRRTNHGLPRGTTSVKIDSEPGPKVAAFFGYGAPIAHPSFGLAGAARHDGTWRLLHGTGQGRDESRSVDLRPPDGTEVVGVIVEPKAKEPALVVVDADRLSLHVLSRSTSVRLPLPTSPIEAACVSAAAPHIAWRTEDGTLSVWSLEHGAYVLRLVREDGRLAPADRGVIP